MQAISSLIWRPLKAHRWRGIWDLGHHWLGRLAFLFAVAAMFTGIYIAAVGWGYYVAYGAALAAFLLLMAFKDLVDIVMVCGHWSCESGGSHLCCDYSLLGSGLGCWVVQSHVTVLLLWKHSRHKTPEAHIVVLSDALLLVFLAGSQAAERHNANGSATQGERHELCSGSDNRHCCVTYWRQMDRKCRRAVSLYQNQEGQSQQGTRQYTFFSANASSGWHHQLWCGNDKSTRDKWKCSKWRWTRSSKWCYLGVIAVLVCDCISV
jgi:hypothetical protein